MTAFEVARNGSKTRQDVVSVRNALPTFSALSDDVVTLVDATNGAAATIVATLATAATEQAFLQKVIVSGLGATAAGSATLTIAGCEGEDFLVRIPVPAGATLALTPVILTFDPPLRAATGDDITATVTTFGAGNLQADVVAIGFKVAAQA
jgi:hypothetical protein